MSGGSGRSTDRRRWAPIGSFLLCLEALPPSFAVQLLFSPSRIALCTHAQRVDPKYRLGPRSHTTRNRNRKKKKKKKEKRCRSRNPLSSRHALPRPLHSQGRSSDISTPHLRAIPGRGSGAPERITDKKGRGNRLRASARTRRAPCPSRRRAQNKKSPPWPTTCSSTAPCATGSSCR